VRGDAFRREAELTAGEPIVDIFQIEQLRNRIIRWCTPFVTFMGLKFFDFVWIDQLLIAGGALVAVMCFLGTTCIALTPTRALLMESGRVLPFPRRIVRTLRGGEVTFIRDRFGESIQIDGKSFNAGRGWGRLRSLMCDDDDNSLPHAG
jgi:hypothetical protein